jgi:hypothetical protein
MADEDEEDEEKEEEDDDDDTLSSRRAIQFFWDVTPFCVVNSPDLQKDHNTFQMSGTTFSNVTL